MLSVIIPTYNRALLLGRALASVFAQTLPCDEIIVVDDGSQDDTPALLEQMRARSPMSRPSPMPLTVIRQDNQGASAARNAGIERSRGELLAFLDADDWWLPTKLAMQVAAMEEEPNTLISHTREIWYRHGQRVNQKKKHDPPGGAIFFRSLAMCVVGMSTVMARRELFERYGMFDENLPCCEDYDLWLRVSRREPFLLVPQALTCKDGGRDDQLSHIHRVGMDVYRIRALQKLIDQGLLDPQQDRAVRQELVRKCNIYGRGCRKHGRIEEAERYLKQAAQYDQISPEIPDEL